MMSYGWPIFWTAVGGFAVAQVVTWHDVDNVSHAEARAFLNQQTHFDSYILGDKVQCRLTKYDDIRGVMFTGTRADGSTFKAMVCPQMQLVVDIPNQPDDPLDVVPNTKSLWWPIEHHYISYITKG